MAHHYHRKSSNGLRTHSIESGTCLPIEILLWATVVALIISLCGMLVSLFDGSNMVIVWTAVSIVSIFELLIVFVLRKYCEMLSKIQGDVSRIVDYLFPSDKRIK